MQQEFRSLNSPVAGAASPALWDRTAQPGLDDVVLSVHADPAAIESIWRSLEQRAPISVYQRYDWVQPWCRYAAPSLGIEPTIVLGSRHRRPAFILPLGRRKTRLGHEISWLGCSHANIALGLYEPEFALSLDGGAVHELFRRIAREIAPVDYFWLHNQPEGWHGMANPLRQLRGCQRDQPVLAIDLNGGFSALATSRRRKKHRWQENALAAAGGYRFYRAANRAEANAILDVFLKQKEQQFANLGVRNVFADDGTIRWIRSMIATSFDRASAIIQLYAVEIDGAIKATFATGVHEGRAHGYFSGITLDEYQRVSPGELLLYNLVRDACENGYDTLDLGVGEERYKAVWSPVREAEFLAIVPVSQRGRIAAALLRLAHGTRIRIRSNEGLWGMAKRVRSWWAKVRRKAR